MRGLLPEGRTQEVRIVLAPGRHIVWDGVPSLEPGPHCADGTWNFRDQADDESKRRHVTNVTKLARAVRARASDGTHQVVIYHDGVGTQKGVEHVVGGATGEGIEDNIRDLYRSISYNYVDGDQAKIGVSTDGHTGVAIFGDMNQQGTLTGSTAANGSCKSSQNGRGGLFYIIENADLAADIAALIAGASGPAQ